MKNNLNFKNWLISNRILIIFTIIIILIVLLNIDQKSSNISKDYKNQNNEYLILPIGAEGIINNNKIKTDCSESSILATNKENLEEFTNILVANDKIGLYDMKNKGKIFLVPNCTKIKVLETLAPGSQRVRILEGSNIGKDGWISYEFIIKK